MATRFKKVAFTCYPVKDMARARKFYEGTLGLSPGENFQESWQEYDFGGTTFAITSMTWDAAKPGSQTSAAFEVADLKAMARELREKGVEFVQMGPEDVMESPVCWAAFIKDPDGNMVCLHQAK